MEEKDGQAIQGAFLTSLKRNNKQIRDDRATAIGDDTELLYKRSIEDLEVTIKRMVREQENMLDLSPTNSMSLTLASDFDAPAYVAKDIELGIKIREANIKLDIAKKRYSYLFGGNE
jgi:UDP-3-O-acyl-N-acetylglucosamine deacetylase